MPFFGLSKVLHQHVVRIIEVGLAVEKRSAVWRDGQTSKIRGGFFETEDRGCLAGAKVKEFYSPVRLKILVDKVDSGTGQYPVAPKHRLIQNLGFLTAL